MARTLLSAQYRGYGPTSPLDKITIRQQFNNHTLMFLDYRFADGKKYIMPAEGTPVKVRWGGPTLADLGTTYGYVNHYDGGNQLAHKSHSTVWCLGTSQPMNANIPTTWLKMTYSGIARAIGTRHKFRTVIHPHPYVLPSWSTGTRSDFKCLSHLAEESGYQAWVDGSTLYFLDPNRVLKGAGGMSYPVFREDQIREALVTGGKNAPRDNPVPTRHRVVNGLDYHTNEFFTATGGDSSAFLQTLPVAANDYSQALQLTLATERYDDIAYSIKATVDGDANVYPGGLVRLAGHRVADDQRGLWLVVSAKHEVTVSDFTTTFIAVRSTKYGPDNIQVSTVSGASPTVDAVVRDGRFWEAELREHVNV